MHHALHAPSSARLVESSTIQDASPSPVTSEHSDPALRSVSATPLLRQGRIRLDPETLLALRLSRLLSQRDMAVDCWRRQVRVSIATIKRVECGHPVSFRTARELARYYTVPLERLFVGSLHS